MPKVKITNNKGVEQTPGSGLFVGSATEIHGQTGYRRIHKAITASTTLTAAQSGIVCYVSASGTSAIAIDLPTAAAAGAGWHGDFIVSNDNDTVTNIDTQADSTLMFVHCADGGTDSLGATVLTERTLVFGVNPTNNARIEIVSDGSVYYAHGFCGTSAEISGSGDAP